MTTRLFLFSLLATTTFANPLENIARQEDCLPCNPDDSTSTKAPAIGSELKDLFVDVLESVKDIRFRRRQADVSLVARKGEFCCRENLDCLNVVNYNIPMCYDKFTTQFAFPDGSWGSLTTGEYTTDEGTANLTSGEYIKKDGEKGDIYSDSPEEKPNSSTLSIPPQWTGAGVGTAVPATEIASFIPTAPAPTPTKGPDATPTAEEVNPTEDGDAESTSVPGVAVRHTGAMGLPMLGAAVYALCAF